MALSARDNPVNRCEDDDRRAARAKAITDTNEDLAAMFTQELYDMTAIVELERMFAL